MLQPYSIVTFATSACLVSAAGHPKNITDFPAAAMYVSARRILATLQDSLEYTVLKRSAAQSLPEISLAVAVLICIKLVWGADGQAR